MITVPIRSLKFGKSGEKPYYTIKILIFGLYTVNLRYFKVFYVIFEAKIALKWTKMLIFKTKEEIKKSKNKRRGQKLNEIDHSELSVKPLIRCATSAHGCWGYLKVICFLEPV